LFLVVQKTWKRKDEKGARVSVSETWLSGNVECFVVETYISWDLHNLHPYYASKNINTS